MPWDKLIGQVPAKNYLRSAMASARLAHGYLFSGVSGVGKRTAAHIFAQVVLCHNRPAPDDACRECKSCRWFAARQGAVIEHPDVIPLIKVVQRGDSRSEKRIGDHEQIIPLEAIQNACEQLHRSPMAGNKRVLIVPEAQRLCRFQAEPANAFLKTLEEPPAASLIILTSSQPEGLIETIISRVQTVQFKRLSSDEVRLGLSRRKSALPESELGLVTALADGSIGRALDFAEGDFGRWREAVVRALRGFDNRNWLPFAAALWQLSQDEGQRLFAAEKNSEQDETEDEGSEAGETAEESAKTAAGWTRHVLLRLFSLCEICFRDGIVFASAGSAGDAVLLQRDSDIAPILAQRFGEEGCAKVLQGLAEAAQATRLYVRGDVITRTLAGRMRDALL